MQRFAAFPRELALKQSIAIGRAGYIRDSIGSANGISRLRRCSRGLQIYGGFGGGVAQNQRQQECKSSERGNHRENSPVQINLHFHSLDFFKMGR
jgi:hypothetical protein